MGRRHGSLRDYHTFLDGRELINQLTAEENTLWTRLKEEDQARDAAAAANLVAEAPPRGTIDKECELVL